jgi:DNA processing protein
MVVEYYDKSSFLCDYGEYNYHGDVYYDMREYSQFPDEPLSVSEYMRYAEDNVEEITAGHEHYPGQYKTFWGDNMPGVLYCLGNSSLFTDKIVMICGSRDVSKKGLEIAYKCGRLCAEMGYIVASGYARGVDMAAHQGVLENGGGTIAILPYGLGKFRRNNVLSEVFDFNSFLAVSELPLSFPFTAGNALRRNKLLVALSHAVIVVESREKGGTWFSAKYAGSKNKPLYYFEGLRKDVAPKLKSVGGIRLRTIKGVPDLKKVERLIEGISAG